jgi:ribosomal protein L11 methyltransferase
LDWLEYSVTTDGETAEAVSELFNRYGQGGAVVEIPVDCFEDGLPADRPPTLVRVKTYLPQNGAADGMQRLEEGLWHLRQIFPIAEADIRTLAEEDWAESWKSQYHRLHVGKRIVIVPAWEQYKPESGEAVIRLEPGMAFGTGLHPTTRLCLQAMEQRLSPGWSVLDLGTGSGVLAIAAAKLGAGSILALDTDPVAVAAARENIAQNEVADRIVVRLGTLPGQGRDQWEGTPWSKPLAPTLPETGTFELVMVNILAPVIIGLAPALAARMEPGGQLIAAGLIQSQERAVERALQAERLRITHRTEERDWICLVAHREGD